MRKRSPSNWLLWFGMVFVGFVLYSPEGLAGIWARLHRRWHPPPEQSANGNKNRIGLTVADYRGAKSTLCPG